MRRFALVFLVACAQTPPSGSPCPPAGGEAGAIDEPSTSDEAPSLAAGIAASGHRCAASKDDPGVTVCEPETPGLVPFVVVQSPPLVLFAAYFKHREEITCTELAPLLNDLNAKADGIKVVCDKGSVSFTTSFVLPERGFTGPEIAEQARRFQALIQLMLHEEALTQRLQ